VSPADYHIAQQDFEMAVWISDVTYLFDASVLIKVKPYVQATETYRESTKFLTSALDGAEWSSLTPRRKRPPPPPPAPPSVPIEKAAGWAVTAGLDVSKKRKISPCAEN
jgi:hypothetical protein